MPLRLATISDLTPISKLLAASFYDEELNDHCFPFREQYPADYLSVWKEKISKDWWDYKKIWVVSFAQGTSPSGITGVAGWAREGEGSDELWGLWRWWDPRRVISPLISIFYRVHRFWFRNRSVPQSTRSDPNPLYKWNFGPRMWPFISRHFTEPPYRHNHWELSTLAVSPPHQRQGIGSQLVAWGLNRAKSEGFPAVVVAAKDTEDFYRRCGFKHLVAYASTEEVEGDEDCVKVSRIDRTNPLNTRGIGGGAIMWTELRDQEK